jgi:hypothetical protein
MKPTASTTLIARLRSVGPYVLIELLLPGGTILALLLSLFSRARGGSTKAPFAAGITTVVERVVGLPFTRAAVIV